MDLGELIDAMALTIDIDAVAARRDRPDPGAPVDWRNLAAVLALSVRAPVIGISGGQGAGKSTFARQLRAALEFGGRSAAGLSLDDFYLTRRARRGLAASVHPLLATRGVPGTHDIDLLMSTLRGLGRAETTRIPVFDKGRDDRLPASRWSRVDGPVAHVIIEGWCLGANSQPQQSLSAPLNELERREDPAGLWRRHVNAALASDYQTVWDAVDYWIYLQVPDFDAVVRWRAQQEQELAADWRMSRDVLPRFVAHYERLTRWMLEIAPQRADLVVQLDADHRIAGVRCRE